MDDYMIAYAGQSDFEQQMAIPEHVHNIKTLLEAFLALGWWGWILAGCFAIGAVTLICYCIGYSSKFAFIKRLLKSWGRLIRGE